MTTIHSRLTDSADAASTIAAPPVSLSRQQILEATFQCLRQEGYDATTIRQIARRLGCAIGSIYRYYRDKRELLYTVTQELLEPVVTLIDIDGSFERSVNLYAKLATNDGEAYRLMFWLACHVEAQPTESNSGIPLPGVVGRIIDGWAKQLGDRDRAEQAWAMLHGATFLGGHVDPIVNLVLKFAQATAPAAASQPAATVFTAELVEARTTAAAPPVPPVPTTPPAPKAPTPPQASAGVAASAAMSTPEQPAEDVCLL